MLSQGPGGVKKIASLNIEVDEMLRSLRIRNLVIIEDLTIEFGPGLNLLTGETGAGKSILVCAVGLAVG